MHKKLLYMLCVITLSLSTISIWTSHESPETKIYVDPPTVEYLTPAYGEVFMINVSLANVLDLKGFEFKLYWNTTLLDLVNVTTPTFLNPPTFTTKNETREDLGRYWLTTISTGSPKSGNGTLAILSFNITYEPIWPQNATCTLDLADTKLVDSNAQPILHDVYDGEYWCYSRPPLNITVQTTSPSYYLLEPIKIQGNLTLGFSPVQDGLVAIEVDDPLNRRIVVRTSLTGTPPTNQIVEIIGVTPCDMWGNPKNSFSRGTVSYFNVTARNNGAETRTVLITINVYDVNLATFGIAAFQALIVAGTVLSVILPIAISYTCLLYTSDAADE